MISLYHMLLNKFNTYLHLIATGLDKNSVLELRKNMIIPILG